MRRMAFLLLCSALSIGCSDSPGDQSPPPRPANLAVMDGEVRTSVEAQLTHIEAHPGDVDARAQLARLYQANNLPAESIATWVQVLEPNPDSAKHWYFLALAYYQNGDYEAARDAAARSRSLDPRQPASWWRAAFWELDMGRPAEAEVLARQAIQLDPNNAGGYVALSRALVAQDRTQEAIQVLNQLRNMASHPYILYLLGQAYQRAGQTEQAEAYFANGQAQQPRYPDAWNLEIIAAQRGLDATLDRIDQLCEDGRLDEAATVIAQARKTWPTDVNILHRRSELFRKRGNTNRWIMELKKALRLDPDNAVTHLNLSLAYLQDNNQSLSMNHAIASTKANPMFPDPHLQMGRLFLLNNDLPNAVQSLDEAFRLGVQIPRERLQYAHVLLRVGRFQEAEQHAQQVTTVDSQNPLAWGVLAETRYAQGKHRSAIEALRLGIQVDPGNESLLRLQRRFSQPPSSGQTRP
ncbi:MAG: tetratricopeptide repeat protein [Planctomycetota bacterium]|nr:tetratricopeptide repeat protein [Planctomycetota bacterium]